MTASKPNIKKQDVGPTIRYLMKLTGKTNADIKRQTGMDHARLSRFLHGYHDMCSTDVFKILTVLDCDVLGTLNFRIRDLLQQRTDKIIIDIVAPVFKEMVMEEVEKLEQYIEGETKNE